LSTSVFPSSKHLTWNPNTTFGPGIMDATNWISDQDRRDETVLDRCRSQAHSHGRRAPTDDLVSELIWAEDEGDRLALDELKMLVSAIPTAGTDTTRNQLGAAVLAFCDHPDQLALLAEDRNWRPRRSNWSPATRPSFRTMRIASEDVELGGLIIPAGTLVGANTASANRDPAVYDDPHHFDNTRHGPTPMLTFGGGIHYCFGVHLAKAELAEALVVMARRIPNIRRVGPAPWKTSLGVGGPITLPVEFFGGHRPAFDHPHP
jgi:cytochrome P450